MCIHKKSMVPCRYDNESFDKDKAGIEWIGKTDSLRHIDIIKGKAFGLSHAIIVRDWHS